MNRTTRGILMAGLLVPLLLLSGCCCALSRRTVGAPNLFGRRIMGSTSKRTIEMDVDGFMGVEAGGVWDVRIERGDQHRVKITTNENMVEYLDVRVVGNTLHLDTRDAYSFSNVTLRADITLPELRQVHVSGSAHATASDAWEPDGLTIHASGATSIQIDEMYTTKADIELSGSSHIEMAGSAQALILRCSGATKAKMEDFVAQEADIQLSGSSDAALQITEKLDVNLSGASNLTYDGNPTIGRQNISGGADLKRR